jgi:outer membrane protein OmpA-like peptidoglycan-associated protein/uncharacterized protein YegP (UPF0339 family)
MRNKIKYLLVCFFIPFALYAQVKLEGYVFEQNNRGYLNQVKISIFELKEGKLATELSTDMDGYFNADLKAGKYRILAEKDIFFEKSDTVNLVAEKAFVKMEMRRRPGYLFDATLAELRESPDSPVDAVQGATVEIYNRTAKRMELEIHDDPDAFFQFTFERGNHYTILIRKEGYLAKRIEVYVNVNGCIICVDGVREVSPGITDNLTSGHQMGTLLANIEMERARLDKRIQIQNIYYDYDKWDIREDAAKRLDNVVVLLRDNPGLSVELGSHTDSRGNDAYNESLSQKRAVSAVAYIVGEGIDSARITAKGYGEKALVNRCINGAECSEAEHQQNRRTELRITGINSVKNWKPLQQIVQEEEGALTVGSAKIKSRDKQLPEANNSVKLGPLVKAEEAPVLETTAEQSSVLYEFGTIRILPLPTTFKGCAVELAQHPNAEISADNPVFKGQKELFHRTDADGSHSYYIVNLGPRDAATAFFDKKVKPVHKNARLVLFSDTGKEYLK